MIGFLKAPAPRESLPEDQADATYRRLRFQVFIGIFVGYAGYYLVRKNFTLAMPYLIELGYSKTDLGLALSACPSPMASPSSSWVRCRSRPVP